MEEEGLGQSVFWDPTTCGFRMGTHIAVNSNPCLHTVLWLFGEALLVTSFPQAYFVFVAECHVVGIRNLSRFCVRVLLLRDPSTGPGIP